MADTHAKHHEYHLVDPSPWPVAGAISAFVLATGGILLMHDVTNILFFIGLFMTIGTMALWWRDVIREGEHQGHHSRVVQLGLRYGMALFIASEVMFFAGFFWAFFNASLFPAEATGGVWPRSSASR